MFEIHLRYMHSLLLSVSLFYSGIAEMCKVTDSKNKLACDAVKLLRNTPSADSLQPLTLERLTQKKNRIFFVFM